MVVARYGHGRQEAYVIASVAADLPIHEVVDVPNSAGYGGDAVTGGPGIDRGDGRDPLGRFTGSGGYGADKEAQACRTTPT